MTSYFRNFPLRSAVEFSVLIYCSCTTKSLCVLALQNSKFEASTSSRPQTVNFEALGHKAIMHERYNIREMHHAAFTRYKAPFVILNYIFELTVDV